MQKNLKKRDRSRVTKREKELFFLKVDFCDIFILCLPKKAKNYFQKKDSMFACVNGQHNIHREAKEKECQCIVIVNIKKKKKKKKKVVYANTHGQTSQHLYIMVKRNRFF